MLVLVVVPVVLRAPVVAGVLLSACRRTRVKLRMHTHSAGVC